MANEYEDFLRSKMALHVPTGMAEVPKLSDALFPFQRDIVRWALRRGRAAIFADTGLGKTRMQIEWARHVAAHGNGRAIILAPLAVAQQTSREGDAVGVPVTVCREMADVREGVNVTNYDRLHKFDPSAFGAVVLDESSIIKHHDAKTLRILLDAFSTTPMRLACTATPSPNDYTELGTHAEFLGVCTRAEMLAEYFCHDGGETQVWRLKGHARKAFWTWIASWAALVRRPSDLGYDDAGYNLPPLRTTHHVIAANQSDTFASGMLFPVAASTMSERRAARRGSLTSRVAQCAQLVNADPTVPWVVWCDLNDESDALTKAIAGAVEVRGSMSSDEKETRLRSFSSGDARVIVSKSSICGFGLNWQHASHMAFVGVTDSFEAYYQAVRRIWRFGQRSPCDVHVFASELEGNVIANLERKARDAATMADELGAETLEALRAEIRGATRERNTYEPRRIAMPSWLTTEAT